MKKFRNIALILLVIVFVTVVVLGITYKINTKAMDSSDSKKIEVVIPEGASIKQIGEILKEKDLIRSSTFFNLYAKLFNIEGLKASKYQLSRDMDLETIIDVLKKGNNYVEEQISITFKEGLNMREIATIIQNTTNNSFEDVISLSNDEEYINELVKKYWFITDDIKNDDLYYKLEGYLFPETYFFAGKNVTVKEIFTKMLNQTDKILSKYKDEMESKQLTPHFVLTMASILEKEGKVRDFEDMSSVFYNRIEQNMKFESCATAIYGVKREFNSIEDRVITNDIMQNDNLYNTYKVQVPIGPIGNPGEDAIKAAINPSESEYVYFLSDNQGKTYFFKTYSEQNSKKNELIKAGKWN